MILALPPASGILIADMICFKNDELTVWIVPCALFDRPYNTPNSPFYGTLKQFLHLQSK